MTEECKCVEEEINEEEKVEEKISEVDALKFECEKLNDKLLRNTAELENFKRRTNEEKQNFMKYASQGVMTDLIGIVDNYERALASIESLVDGNTFLGVKMILDQLNNVLISNGVEEIKSVGEVFDPNVHQAVMTDNNSDFDSGVVTEELQKGYQMKDRILRPAMVKVNE